MTNEILHSIIIVTLSCTILQKLFATSFSGENIFKSQVDTRSMLAIANLSMQMTSRLMWFLARIKMKYEESAIATATIIARIATMFFYGFH